MTLSTQKPLSNDTTEVTSANFPALAHFFPCTETSPQTTGIVDTVGGVTTGVFDAGTGDGQKLTSISQTLNTALASGSWTAPTTKNIVAFYVGNIAASVINVGTIGTTGGINFNGITGAGRTYDGTTTSATSGETFAAEVEANILVEIPSTSLTVYRLDADGTYASGGTPDSTGIPTTIADMNDVSTIGLTGTAAITSLYGLAIFYFNTLPGDLETAIQWMYNEWVNNNNKAIYPGWKNRA